MGVCPGFIAMQQIFLTFSDKTTVFTVLTVK